MEKLPKKSRISVQLEEDCIAIISDDATVVLSLGEVSSLVFVLEKVVDSLKARGEYKDEGGVELI